MHYQSVNANIMSLGASRSRRDGRCGDRDDREAHKRIEAWEHAHPDAKLQGEERWALIGEAAAEVGPALFFSLLIITLSFVPVFALEAQEGRLFSPLAYTKTYAMAASAGLAVTLIPVLMGYLIRGRIPQERKNPLSRWLIALYRPLLAAVLRFPKLTILVAVVALGVTAFPVSRLGGEFLPPLYEGDLLYMPTALPGLSASKASEILQQTDRLIATVPEVRRVFGKIGRAETATDPAPLEMVETIVQLKPRAEWRPGMTPEKLVEELDALVKQPGSPTSGSRRSATASTCSRPGSSRSGSGRGQPRGDRARRPGDRACREGRRASLRRSPSVSPADGTSRCTSIATLRRASVCRWQMCNLWCRPRSAAENIGETIEGRRRFPINVRYPREVRDSVRLRALQGDRRRRADRARLGGAHRDRGRAASLRSENARLGLDLCRHSRARSVIVVADAKRAVEANVKLPPGVSVARSGQFEISSAPVKRLAVVVLFTGAIIFLLLYLTFRRFDERCFS